MAIHKSAFAVAVRLSKKNGVAEVGRNLTSGCDVTGENEGVCPPKKISLDHKVIKVFVFLT